MASSMTRMIGAAHPAQPAAQPLSTEETSPPEAPKESVLPAPDPELETSIAEKVELPKRKPPPKKKKDSLPAEINTVSETPAELASPAVSPEETVEPASSKKKEKREKKR